MTYKAAYAPRKRPLTRVIFHVLCQSLHDIPAKLFPHRPRTDSTEWNCQFKGETVSRLSIRRLCSFCWLVHLQQFTDGVLRHYLLPGHTEAAEIP